MKKNTRLISYILAVLILSTALPGRILAKQPTKQPAKSTSVVSKKDTKNEAKILEELVDKREKNVKQFLKDDGTYEAVIYPNPVHYLDNGVWKDIDNSLNEVGDTSNIGDKALTNKQNDFQIKIDENANSKSLVSIQKNKYKVGWNIDNVNSSSAKIGKIDDNSINNEINKSVNKDLEKIQDKAEKDKVKPILVENEKKKTLKNISSEVTFNNIFTDVDLEYIVNSNKVKENIILNKPSSTKEYIFNLKVDNLIPKIQANNSIIFYDSKDLKKAVFQMQPPIMADNKKESSNKIKISLEEEGDGYKLTLKPDEKWLQDSSRVYPVTIDPPIQTSLDPNTIYDSFIAQGYPNNNYYLSTYIGVGNSTYGVLRSFIKFDLPTLRTGSIVTNAELALTLYNSTSISTNVDVYKVNTDWSSSSITWNNAPSYDPLMKDYKYVYGAAYDQYYFNVTSVVKDWYTKGSNFGLMLKSNDENNGFNLFASSDCTSQYAVYRPQITLTYIDNSGLENYWTYHSQSVGRAGTGYINDYNGNLVFKHADLSLSGNRMPVNIEHVYNSTYSNTDFGFGYGWRLNLSQIIYVDSATGVYYLIDEDGTRHYFYFDSITNSYKDETGLNITLYLNSDGTYTIKDKDGNQLIFSNKSYLWKLIDNNGNTEVLTYNGSALATVTDGAGRVTTLDSDASGHLLGITDPSGRRTSYSYIGNNLKTITYPDGKQTTYNYDSNNYLISATNYDGLKVAYTYSVGAVKRVTDILQSNTDGTLGNDTTLTYGNNMTNFTDVKGRKDTYLFNDWGNTVSTRDSQGNANFTRYNETVNDPNKNKTLLDSKIQKTTPNYLLNHNFEYDTNWSFANDGTSTATGELTTADKYLVGQRSATIVKTNSSSRSYYQQSLTLEKGKTYTYSGYIKTNGISNASGQGANLLIHYHNSSGAWLESSSSFVSGTNDWQRYEVTFTIPSDATTADVIARVAITSETGTAYFDSLQLEDGSVANRYNLIENGDFRNGSSSFWNMDRVGLNDTVVNLSSTEDPNYPSANIDRNAFKLSGEEGSVRSITQTINYSGKAGDTFVLSGWAKANAISETNPYWGGFYIEVEFNDEWDSWGGSVNLNVDSPDWQYASSVIKSDYDYTSITFVCTYSDEANTAYFDGLRLYKEEFGNSYSYDSNGNLASTVDIAKQNSSFSYNSANDLIKATDPRGNSFNYTYDNNHNIKTSNSAENVVYTFSYDSYGNPLTSKVGDSTLFINSSASYTPSGNYINSIADSSGNNVKSNWNESKGLLNSVTDAKQKVTSYTYDNNTDNLLSASKTVDGGVITNSYGYLNDRLNSITHNGFSYNFGYDSQGNNTTVSVGSQNLITNSYEARTSKLLNSTYGNGQQVSNDYDGLDRVIAKKYNGNTRYTYEYDASGNIGYQQDLINGTSYRYVYDIANRLVQVKDSLGNILSYSYDSNNNNSKVSDKVNGTTYDTNYGYDKDNRLNSITYNRATSNTITPNYDALGRISSKSINTGVAGYNTVYGYTPGANGSTTSRIGSIKNNLNSISYNYDDNGNIVNILKGTNDSNLLKNSNFKSGTAYWSGIDSINTDTTYGNVAYKSVVNNQLQITQSLNNISQGTYNMSAIIKTDNNTDLEGVGFVFYYTDGTYTDYTWTSNKITDLGNGYKLYEKSGRSNTSKTISRVDVRIFSSLNKTLNVTVAQVKFAAQDNLLVNNNFISGTASWSGIDSINTDATYGNVAYKSVVNNQSQITQSLNNISQGTYNMFSVLKSNNYTDLAGVGFVFFYTDGTYTDYTWSSNKITDLGNGYKLYEKQGSSDSSKAISRVDVRIYSLPNKTLDVTVAQVNFAEAISNIKYYYNELNEVIREDNQTLNKTITYSYDAGGNLINKTEYPYTTSTLGTAAKNYSYVYGDTNWKDKLTSYDGKAITYDAIGNPLTYNGWTYNWEEGRQLQSINGNGNNISYKYNDAGIRTQKIANGVITNYHLVGNKVTYETNGTDKIYYTYDSSDNLVSMSLNGVEYYYIRNTQGDIIGLFDKTGVQVVSYTYDTWGKLISTTGNLASTVGTKNPYLYRGYRYDTETGFYYLQSRYYNPEWGRFINSDAIAGQVGELLSHNVFAYCQNNPTNKFDPSGFMALDNEGRGRTSPSTVNVSKKTKTDISWSPSGSVAVAVSAGLKVAGDHLDDIKVGTRIISTKYTGPIPLPKTLGALGKVSGVMGILFTFNSLKDDINNKQYTLAEKLIRIALDGGGFVVSAAFFAEGGWVPFLGTVLVAGVVEAGKYYTPAILKKIGYD